MKPMENFTLKAVMGNKPRNLVNLRRKSFDVSEIASMFVLKLRMTVTSVIPNFKINKPQNTQENEPFY